MSTRIRGKKQNRAQPPAKTEQAQKLEPKQVLALSELLQGEKPGVVARKLDVSRTTVWRWLKEPAFAEALATLQADLTRDARARLRTLARDAVDELGELLDCEDPKVRLAAANSILDRAGVDGSPDPDAEQRIWDITFSATIWETPA